MIEAPSSAPDPDSSPTAPEGTALGKIGSGPEGLPPGAGGAPSHPGLTVWFTGLSCAGKTTLSRAVGQCLRARGYRVEILDGEEVRQHISKGLGFSKEDRDENIRRIGFVAQLLTRNGVIVLVSAISPYRATRDEIRRNIGSFVEVYVNAPLEVCEQRDVQGLYRKARAGLIKGFTGIDDPYEPPLAPEVECRTDCQSVAASVEKILSYVDGLLHSGAAETGWQGGKESA